MFRHIRSAILRELKVILMKLLYYVMRAKIDKMYQVNIYRMMSIAVVQMLIK
jgi:hypothetical protein